MTYKFISIIIYIMEKIRLRDDLTVTFPDNYSRKEIDEWLAWWYKNNNKLH